MKQGSANVSYIHQDSLGGTSVGSDANGGALVSSMGTLVASTNIVPFGMT